LSNPVAISATYTSTPVQCFGGSNGTVDVTVSGGTAPYTYNWSNGAITQDIQNQAAGNDTLIITDFVGCIHTLITAVSQPTELVINDSIQNVGCFGTLTGGINLTIVGGTPGYSFQWLSGQLTEDLSGLGAGTYTVNVNDFNGCVATDSFTITAPTTPMQLALTGVGLTCYNSSTGTTDLTGLPAGTYEVFVEDVNGCLDSAEITLNNPTPLLFSAVVTNVQCFGQATGSIDLSVSGGAQPYFFSWTGANGFTASTEDISNLPLGTYDVTITDFNGCVVTGVYFVNQPTSEAVITSTVNNILCYGATTGWINASAVGGALPYSYLWLGPGGSFAGTTEDLFGIGAGWYELFVTDAA
ncbi:MAG: SprB repeat-containing protein, partial [Flavobacteriia bacterium]